LLFFNPLADKRFPSNAGQLVSSARFENQLK